MRKKIALGGLMMVATMVLAEPAMAQELVQQRCYE